MDDRNTAAFDPVAINNNLAGACISTLHGASWSNATRITPHYVAREFRRIAVCAWLGTGKAADSCRLLTKEERACVPRLVTFREYLPCSFKMNAAVFADGAVIAWASGATAANLSAEDIKRTYLEAHSKGAAALTRPASPRWAAAQRVEAENFRREARRSRGRELSLQEAAA